jgi:hypothetical protein
MGITSLLTRQCKQVAVYWGNPVNDGEGGFTFDDPVELYCRWEEMKQVVTDNKGVEVSSRAVVYLLQDVDEEGMLYLGRLTDLSSAEEGDPKTVEGAYIIKRFEKTPALGSTTVFVRRAYLTPSLSFGGF